MLATGAMAYVSAPLWLLYVVLGALLWLVGGNVLFTPEGTLAIGIPGLWAGTLTMLVLPRLLGVAAVFMRRETGRFGGGAQAGAERRSSKPRWRCCSRRCAWSRTRCSSSAR